MKKLFILSFPIFLTSMLFAQQTSTAAIKETINTMMDAMRKGDSSLLKSVLAKNLELESVAGDEMGKVIMSTKGANDLATQIGTPHADVYDERIDFGDIKIDGPLASVWASYKFYLGATFSHCGVNFFQLAKAEDGWKIKHIEYTVRKDNCLSFDLANSSVFAQLMQMQMVAEWQRAKIYTKAYLDAMPEDGYGFKPTPEIRSFAQQMLHLSDANYVFATAASDKPNPVETGDAHNVNEKMVSPTKEATTKAVMDSYDWVITTIQNMTPDQMQQTTKFGRHDNVPRCALFDKAFEHQTHTRGQTTIYLRLKGVTPPAEQLF